MEVNILTKNRYKILAAEKAFGKYSIKVNFIDKDYPEIQADTSLEIAAHTAKIAAKELGIPIIREDHSFFIKALGIPGPYSNYVERKLGSSGLLKLISNLPDKSAYFELATVYAWPDGKVKTWVYQMPVVISEEPRGNLANDWDLVLMHENETRTFAEYPIEERIDVWAKNFEEIAKAIIAGEI